MVDYCDDTAFIQGRIDRKMALVLVYETAMEALAGGVQSYQLDTGQSRQLVTKTDLGSMRIALRELEGDIASLRLRLGCGKIYVVPSW